MSVFAAKLDAIPETIRAVLSDGVPSLVAAVADSRANHVIAVGSGGSCISAAYLGACRSTLSPALTSLQTPMEICLGDGSLVGSEVFLFSAAGNNADILAAHRSAIDRGASRVHVVTNNTSGKLARACADFQQSKLHVVPTSDAKDGFLATHSLVSAITALLLASDAAANRSCSPSAKVVEDFHCASEIVLSSALRSTMCGTLATVRPTDTILLLHDPRLLPVALLIETSVWEASICAVQRTDHRNFAHGRHVWLRHRPADTLVMSLAVSDSAPVWAALDVAIPDDIRRFELDLPNCGRLELALAILRGLTIVEALGVATSIDPAKPGAGKFAEAMYNSEALLNVADVLPAAVRHKRAAMSKADLPQACSLSLIGSFNALKARLKEAVFRGMVLDYDGTLVTNEGRFEVPGGPILAELERLLGDGMRIAIATGRGGSAGEGLRQVLPARFHNEMLVGYYNGGDIRTLDVDLRTAPLKKAPEIEAVERWFDERGDLFGPSPRIRRSPVQIAVELSSILDVQSFQSAFHARFSASNSIRIAHSAHTIDLYLASSCKTNVFRRLMELTGSAEDEILCIGDSGDPTGNDYALLGLPFGLSVDQVCCRTDVGWALLGGTVKGPAAVARVLKALKADGAGRFKMDVDVL